MVTFAHTGAAQTWLVPAGVTQIDVECWGAAAESVYYGNGGLGAYAKGRLNVTPGETLNIFVGGKSFNNSGTPNFESNAGFNGGGTSPVCAGGGASDVRQGGAALADRKIVAGGGGGTGYAEGIAAGGTGGTTEGGAGGVYGGAGAPASYGGGGGTQAAGGAAGGGAGGAIPNTSSTAGALGVGGAGATHLAINANGGGGGGGYYGGGGGHATTWNSINTAGGGGGGSSYVGGVIAPITQTANTRAGHGQVVITIVSLPPNAPGSLSPAGAVSIDRAVTQRFSWAFSDPNPGDTQSKFDLQYRIGTGAWTTVTQTTPNNFYDFPPGTFVAGSYEWQVRTYDGLGAVGPWSSSAFFTAADVPGVPTITSPVNGGTVGTSNANLTWSTPSQTAYQVRKVADSAGAPDTATVYYDSGTVTDSTARTAALAFPVNSRFEHLQLRVLANGLWSSWASVRVMVSYTPPATPTLVLTPSDATAQIFVAITHPTPTGTQPVVSFSDVHRREVGAATDIRIATGVASSYTDRTPASGVAYEYQVVAHGANNVDALSAWTT